MSLNKDLINSLVKVTSRAAVNCYQYLGKENKKLADKALSANFLFSLPRY